MGTSLFLMIVGMGVVYWYWGAFFKSYNKNRQGNLKKTGLWEGDGKLKVMLMWNAGVIIF